MKWPTTTNDNAESYLVFVERDLADQNQWLLSQPDYRGLVELQEKIDRLEEEAIKAERDQHEYEITARPASGETACRHRSVRIKE